MQILPIKKTVLQMRHPDKIYQFLHDGWPEFMWKATTEEDVNFYSAIEAFPHCQVIMMDDTLTEIIATGHGVIAPWENDYFPDTGYDQAIIDSLDHNHCLKTYVGLAVTIHPDYRGSGISAQMLVAMRNRAIELGLKRVIIPVKPPLKRQYPLMSMENFLEMKRDDGSHIDPWIRTQLKVGGVIKGVCHKSVELKATKEDWERWCGPINPDMTAKHLMAPLTEDYKYIEPNVWIQHL